jgi:excisionase family DNA binding protein
MVGLEMKSTDQKDLVWLTVDEAAQYLKVKPRTLLLWVRRGKVLAFALSGTKRRVWRFGKQDLDATLLANPVVHSFPPVVLSERSTN